jgi:hypothetical protein
VARELLPETTIDSDLDPEDQSVLRLLGHASVGYAPGHRLDVFALRQWDGSSRPAVGELLERNERDESDADLLWLGIRAIGDFDLDRFGSLGYWADLALVQGSEDTYSFRQVRDRLRVRRRVERRVFGLGGDAGINYTANLPLRPSLTLGYAWASGDDGAGDDGGFRQTGLQRNNDRFRGVNRFRYYGELLDPELSNLGIATVSLGVAVLRSSSVELAWHHYRQSQPSRELRGSRLDMDPNGVDRAIGQELDLVIGLQEWDHIEVEIVGSAFRAGRAFDRAPSRWSFGGFLSIEYRF